jgi:hypothetical protein
LNGNFLQFKAANPGLMVVCDIEISGNVPDENFDERLK